MVCGVQIQLNVLSRQLSVRENFIESLRSSACKYPEERNTMNEF